MSTCAGNLDQTNYRRRKNKARNSLGSSKRDSSKVSEIVDHQDSTCDSVESTDVKGICDECPEVLVDIFDLLSIYQEAEAIYKSLESQVETFGGSNLTNGCSRFRVTSIDPAEYISKHSLSKSHKLDDNGNELGIAKNIPKKVAKPRLKPRFDEIIGLDSIFKKSLFVQCENLDIDEFCRKNNFRKLNSHTVLLKSLEERSESKLNSAANSVCDSPVVKASADFRSVQHGSDVIGKKLLKNSQPYLSNNICTNIVKSKNNENSITKIFGFQKAPNSGIPKVGLAKTSTGSSSSTSASGRAPYKVVLTPSTNIRTSNEELDSKNCNLLKLSKPSHSANSGTFDPSNSSFASASSTDLTYPTSIPLKAETVSSGQRNSSFISDGNSTSLLNQESIASLPKISLEETNSILESFLQLAIGQNDGICSSDSPEAAKTASQLSDQPLSIDPELSLDLQKLIQASISSCPDFIQGNSVPHFDDTGDVPDESFEDDGYVDVEKSDDDILEDYISSEEEEEEEEEEIKNVSDIQQEMESIMLNAKQTKAAPVEKTLAPVQDNNSPPVGGGVSSGDDYGFGCSRYNAELDCLLFGGTSDFDLSFTEEVDCNDKEYDLPPAIIEKPAIEVPVHKTETAKPGRNKASSSKGKKQDTDTSSGSKPAINVSNPTAPQKITVKITRKVGKGKNASGSGGTWTSETKLEDTSCSRESGVKDHISLASENGMKKNESKRKSKWHNKGNETGTQHFSRSEVPRSSVIPKSSGSVCHKDGADAIRAKETVPSKNKIVSEHSPALLSESNKKKCKTKSKKLPVKSLRSENDPSDFAFRSSKKKTVKISKNQAKIESFFPRKRIRGSRSTLSRLSKIKNKAFKSQSNKKRRKVCFKVKRKDSEVSTDIIPNMSTSVECDLKMIDSDVAVCQTGVKMSGDKNLIEDEVQIENGCVFAENENDNSNDVGNVGESEGVSNIVATADDSEGSAKCHEASDKPLNSSPLRGFQIVDEELDDSSCSGSQPGDTHSNNGEVTEGYELDKAGRLDQAPIAEEFLEEVDENEGDRSGDGEKDEANVDEKSDVSEKKNDSSFEDDYQRDDGSIEDADQKHEDSIEEEDQKYDGSMEDDSSMEEGNEKGISMQEGHQKGDVCMEREGEHEEGDEKNHGSNEEYDMKNDCAMEEDQKDDGSEQLFPSSGDSENSTYETNDSLLKEASPSPKIMDRISDLGSNQDKDSGESLPPDDNEVPSSAADHAEHLSGQELEDSTSALPSSHVSPKNSDACIRSIRRKYAKSAANRKTPVRSVGRPRKNLLSVETPDVKNQVSSGDVDSNAVNNSLDNAEGSETEVPKDSRFVEPTESPQVDDQSVNEEANSENDLLEKNADDSLRTSKRRSKKKEFADHVSFDFKRTSLRGEKLSVESKALPDEETPPIPDTLVSTSERTPVKVKSKGPKKSVEPKVSATPSPFRGRKSKATYDKEKVKVPFNSGWMREIVHRATFDKTKVSRAIDIYYFTPEGNKLRSMPDVSKYLADHKSLGLTIENFTFTKDKIYREPFEKERGARPRVGDGVEESPVQQSKEEPASVKKESRKSMPASAKKVKKDVAPPTVSETSNCDKDSSNKLPQRSARKLKRTYSELDKGEDIEEDSNCLTETQTSSSKNSAKNVIDKQVTSVTNKSKDQSSSSTSHLQKTQVSVAPSREKRNKRVSTKLKHPPTSLAEEDSSVKKKKKPAQETVSPPRKRLRIKLTPIRGFEKKKYGGEKSSKQGS